MRALKYHGGVEVADLPRENVAALEKGIANLERHIDNVRDRFGLPCVVAINHRAEDTDAEIQQLIERASHHGVKVILARHFAEGGAGALEVAKEVVHLCEQPNYFKFVYEDTLPLWDKMKTIATKIYGASDITADAKVRARSTRCRTPATATIRCASPRRSIRSPPTRSCAARPVVTWSTSAKCGWPRARSSS